MPYTKNKEGHLIPNIQMSNNEEYEKHLGKYGRMALMHLQETNPIRLMELQMEGTILEEMHRIHERAMVQVEKIWTELIEKNPAPQTEDILVRTQHLNQLKSQAEEIVINELIYQNN